MQKDNRFDIDAREAEIVGKPQRIRSLTREEFDEAAKAMVVALRAERRLQTDQINALFGLMMRHPGLFRCQMEMGKQPLKGEISPRERELAVLRVGWFRRAGLERA